MLEVEDVNTSLFKFLLQYRNCKYATTRVARSVVLLGRRLRSRLNTMRPNRASIVEKEQDKQRRYVVGVIWSFEVGDKILSWNYVKK